MKAKEIAVIAICAALLFSMQALFPILMVPLYIVLGSVLKRTHGILLGVILGIISFLLTGQLLTLSNILLLPLLLQFMYVVRPFYVTQNSDCLVNQRQKIVPLVLTVFAGVFCITILAEVFALFLYGYPFAVFIPVVLHSAAGAVISAIIVGVVSQTLQQFIAKLLLKIGI